MKEITDADSDVVKVAYKAMNGEIRVMPWTDVDPLAVADGRPWREFPWYLGQRHYSGMYWSATEAKLVGYVNRPAFDAHLLSWEGASHAEQVRPGDAGQGCPFGAGAPR